MVQVIPSLSGFTELGSSHPKIPMGISRPLGKNETPSLLFQRLFLDLPHSFLLESGNLNPKTARYSFMGGDPKLIFKSRDHRIEEINPKEGETFTYQGDPLTNLRKHMQGISPHLPKGIPPFTGGGVGFFSYDLVRLFERLPEQARDDLKIPDVYLVFADEVLAIDHLEERLWLIRWVESGIPYDTAVADLRERLDRVGRPDSTQNIAITRHSGSNRSPDLLHSFSQEAFEAAVKRTKDYIGAGDIFQLNLSVRMEQEIAVHPWLIYEALRELNPSPFMGYLNFGEYQVVCGSPERLVKLEKGVAETRPIAGTRRKGKSEEDEAAMARELMESAKEQAEHIMLVDLERNDLGKVCEYGSVKVDELLTIEKYSHVMHLVSNVAGKLHPRYDRLSVLRAMFPGGTITGCPKVRCMEIIEELEPVRRGLYTGSIGYLDYSGNMDLNIVIRSLFCVKSGEGYKGYIQVGAGIVADSVPKREYQECLNKAKAMLKAIEVANRL